MTDDNVDLPPMDVGGPSDETRDAIRAAVMAELEPVETMSLAKRASYVLAAALASAAVGVVSFGSGGLSEITRHVAATVACVLVAGVATLAIGGSFSESGQRLLGRNNRIIFVISLVVAWSLYLFSHMTDQALSTAFAAGAVGCGVRSLIAGVIACAAFMWIWRKSDPWTPRISGALFGAMAGVIASASVGIPCAAEHGGHLLVGHWLAIPLLALAGTLMARRILAP